MRRHVRNITRARPAPAQLEELIQLVALIDGIIGVFDDLLDLAEDSYNLFARIFLPQKSA